MSQSADFSPSHAKKRYRLPNNEAGKTEWKRWDENEVQRQLQKAEMPQKVIELVRDSKARGKDLKHLGRLDILMMKGLELKDCFKFLDFLEDHGCIEPKASEDQKIVNDPIHGNIRLHPVCIAVIDTPQFQRLRNLKQLGLCYFVYPGAAHNRFEHCIGVCYLAGQFVRTLRDNQPWLGITEIDCLCVELAGLCHDLGHGPFSHLFDGKFIPAVLPDRKWKHEEASAKLFEYLVKVNGLMEEEGRLKKFGLNNDDIRFITEQIAGPSGQGSGEWPYKGRPKEKAYLYEIVANKRNGIDVDKWDYLARDCHQLGFRNNFDHGRFIKFARVNEMHGEMQICIRDKEIVNLYSMFFTRYTLHKNAYQHKVNGALEMMVSQALIKANDHVKIPGANGKMCKLSETIDDMKAFTWLTDNILYKILDTDSEEQDMLKAQTIIKRIFQRDLYKCVNQSKPIGTEEFLELLGTEDTKILEKEILSTHEELSESSEVKLEQGDFFVQIVHMDFGMKDENPVEKLNVYSKAEPNVARSITKDETSKILAPYIYKEYLLRIYSCDRKREKCEVIGNAFDKWFDKKNKEMEEKREKEKQQGDNSQS